MGKSNRENMSTTIMIDALAHKATMCATSALVFKLFGTIMIQGGKRFPAGTRPPEDGSLSLAKGKAQSFGQADQDKIKPHHIMADIRWQRIVHNDLENIPVGLAVAWGSLLSPASPTLHAGMVLLFAAARVGHTVSYAYELQPHRAIFWVVAALCMLGMAVNGVLGVL